MNKAIKRIAVMALALVLMCCGAGNIPVVAEGASSISSEMGTFVTDSQFQKFRNANAENLIGVSGDFGLMAFNTLDVTNQDIDGNFATKNYVCQGSTNTGTKYYGSEINYIENPTEGQNYSGIGRNTGEDYACDDYLYVGNSIFNGKNVGNIPSDHLIEDKNLLNLDKIKDDLLNKQQDFLKQDTSSGITVKSYGSSKVLVTVNSENSPVYLNIKVQSYKKWDQSTGYHFFVKGENGNDIQIDEGNGSNLIFNFIKQSDGQYPTIIVNIDGTELPANAAIDMPNIARTFDVPEDQYNQIDNKVEQPHERGKSGEPFNSSTILNFANFSNKTINMYRTIATTLAPGATVNLTQNHDGTCVADNINVKAEFHRNDLISPTANLTVTKTFSSNVTTKPKSVKVAIFNKKFLPNDFKDGDSIFNDNGTLKAIPFDVKDIDTSGNDSYTTTFTGLNPSETYIVYEIAYTKTDGTVVPITEKALNFTNQSKNQTVNVSARTSEFTSTTSAVDKTNADNWTETIGNSSKGTHGANRTRKKWTVNKIFEDESKAKNVQSITVQLFKYDSQGKTKTPVTDSSGKDITRTIDITENNNVYSGSLNYNNPSLRDLYNGEYYRFDEISYTLKGNPEKTVEIGSDDSEFTATNVNDPNPTSDDTTKNAETITNQDAAEITVRKIVEPGNGTTLNANDIPSKVTFNIYKCDSAGKATGDPVKTVELTGFTQDKSSVTKTIKGLPAGPAGSSYTAQEVSYTIGGRDVQIGNSTKYTTTSKTSTDNNGKKTVTFTNTTQPSIIKTGIRTTTDAVGLAVILGSAGLVIALAIRSKMLNRA